MSRTTFLPTLVWPMSMPSFHNLPWMRGATSVRVVAAYSVRIS